MNEQEVRWLFFEPFEAPAWRARWVEPIEAPGPRP
jgi:hypothetical protein